TAAARNVHGSPDRAVPTRSAPVVDDVSDLSGRRSAVRRFAMGRRVSGGRRSVAARYHPLDGYAYTERLVVPVLSDSAAVTFCEASVRSVMHMTPIFLWFTTERVLCICDRVETIEPAERRGAVRCRAPGADAS